MTVKYLTFKICIILICLAVDAYGDCNYQACLKKLGTKDMEDFSEHRATTKHFLDDPHDGGDICSALKSAIDCALQTLENNPDCSNLKIEIDEYLSKARTIMKDKSCPDNASRLTTPIVLCVALSCVTFWLMTFV